MNEVTDPQLRMDSIRTAEDYVQTLISKAPLSGTPDAILVALYQNHAVELERYTIQKMRSVERAEDILHDAFLIAHQKLNEGEIVEHGRAWLYAIVRNLIRDAIKKDARRKTNADDTLDRFSSETEQHDTRSNNAMLVQMILGEMEDMFSEVLMLHDVQGLKTREIADVLDVSINTVSSRIRLGRAKFKSHFERLEGSK